MNTSKVMALASGERLLSILNVTFMVAIFLSLFAIGAGDKVQSDGSSNVMRQLTWIVIGLLVLVRCVSFNRKLKLDFQPTGALWLSLLLLAYCLASFWWSAIPMVTFKRAILFGLMVMMCFATFGRRSAVPASFLQLLAWPLGLLLVLSFVFAAASPGIAITAIGWRGVTSFKNEFGQLCAIALLVFTFGFFEFRRQGLMLTLALLSLLGLVLSQSSTCTVAVLAGLLCSLSLLLLRRLSRRKGGSVLLLGSCVLMLLTLLGLLVFGGLDDGGDISDKLFNLLGKSSTLTGRTKLWALVLDNIRLHNPWLGGGYGGFWNGLGSPSNFTSYRFPAGYVGQAHNGYLDIYNDLGYIGLALLAVILLVYLLNILARYREDSPEFYFHLAFFVYIVLENYAESTFFRLVGFLNIVFFASLARVARKWVFERAVDDKKQAGL